MANQEQLDILKQGVEAWNQWRKEHPDIRPDLEEANLYRAYLSGANLIGANLYKANLIEANLIGADLYKANLITAGLGEANLSSANLIEANLIGANLIGANLYKANLYRADLIGANLYKANLIAAGLGEANLSSANLSEADLSEANLYKANLYRADLSLASLKGASLKEADLKEANLSRANLSRANLSLASLKGASLKEADLSRAILRGAIFGEIDELITVPGRGNVHRIIRPSLWRAILYEADLSGAILREADMSEAFLRRAILYNSNLSKTDLSYADLSEADLSKAILIGTDLSFASLIDCRIYGISAWDVCLNETKQVNLVITENDQATITVDNLEVSQFIYLLLNNKKIRDVIDTITSKVVLILGRFTVERKAVLDALRDELRKQNYLPILFDFEKPVHRDITETVSTLAHLARFIIADLTDPSSIPQELQAIVPTLAVPVQPVLLEGKREYAMFVDFPKTYHWVLPVHYYRDQANLLTTLKEHIIDPAEQKAKELEKR